MRGSKYNDEFLISEIKRFYKENNKPPTASDFDKNNGFPNRKTYQKHFGTFGNALVQAGFNYRGLKESEIGKKRSPSRKRSKLFTKDEIKMYIDEYIIKFNKIPTLTELETIPNFPIRSDFRRLFGTYNNAMKEFNLHPKDRRYDEGELKEFVFKYINENNKVPSIVDIEDNKDYPSSQQYINRFGSWSNALLCFGITSHTYKSIEEQKEDLIKLCNSIHTNENRRILNYSDINKCNFCLSAQTYNRNLKKELNITLRDFLNSIGFELTNPGVGMTHKYSDGEITTSKWEFIVSEYLRKNNIEYNRNIRYDSFVDDYKGKKDCDYVINHNGELWYIEIAGMLDLEKMSKNSKIEQDYKNRLNVKINMLEKAKVKYKIIYPHEIREHSLDELFSFLYK